MRFPISLRWSSYVAPKSPKWGSKTQKSRFSYKIALRLKKVCYNVYSCENCQRECCGAFIGLTIDLFVACRSKIRSKAKHIQSCRWNDILTRTLYTTQWLRPPRKSSETTCRRIFQLQQRYSYHVDFVKQAFACFVDRIDVYCSEVTKTKSINR